MNYISIELLLKMLVFVWLHLGNSGCNISRGGTKRGGAAAWGAGDYEAAPTSRDHVAWKSTGDDGREKESNRHSHTTLWGSSKMQGGPDHHGAGSKPGLTPACFCCTANCQVLGLPHPVGEIARMTETTEVGRWALRFRMRTRQLSSSPPPASALPLLWGHWGRDKRRTVQGHMAN